MGNIHCRSTAVLLFLVLLALSCEEEKKTELIWDKPYFQLGSQSSPRAADLNLDGTKDIVIGMGKGELEEVEQGVLALDGATGQELWRQRADAQMVGSATFYDITEDGIPDVIIGGRKHNLKAMDGRDGTVIWEYEYKFDNDPILQYARYNFYNSTVVPDQDGDGAPEILTVNGGNWNAAPRSEDDRFPGVLMLLNARTGAVIAADTMPDGRESYMSPLCFRQPGDSEFHIIFGTGGETVSGNLYLATLSDLYDRALKNARVLVTEDGHGFIAPPSLADVTGDGYLDAMALSHGGTMTAIDVRAQKIVWQKSFPEMESSNAMAIGHLNRDKTPDVFAILCKGTWPLYTRSLRIALDGRNGNVIYRDTSGCFELSSPVAYDLTGDGYDEVLLSGNRYDCTLPLSKDNPSPTEISNLLMAINIRKQYIQVVDESKGFKNLYSTPWIGDLDADGYLDIVYCQFRNTNTDFSRSLGVRIRRISSHIKVRSEVVWGEYMGPGGKGVFPL